MGKCLVYIHGKGGTAEEAQHYVPLFAGHEVIGFDYQTQTPWEAQAEFSHFFSKLSGKYEQITIVANSIGAFFALHALKDVNIFEAYFISPIVNMEKLITNMMQRAGVSIEELKQRRIIETAFGESLSYPYLDWVQNYPINWHTKTHILYGSKDNLQSLKDIQAFAAQSGADVTIMENGEHWFHTKEQMQFLDNWILKKIA